jgi:hypothetical protein
MDLTDPVRGGARCTGGDTRAGKGCTVYRGSWVVAVQGKSQGRVSRVQTPGLEEAKKNKNKAQGGSATKIRLMGECKQK